MPRPGTGCPRGKATLSVFVFGVTLSMLCQKEVPPCALPCCPQGPPLCTPRPRAPQCTGVGSAARWHWADAVLATHVLKCAEENLGKVPGDCPPCWIWPGLIPCIQDQAQGAEGSRAGWVWDGATLCTHGLPVGAGGSPV